MTPAQRPSEVWKTLPWQKIQRNVFRLQKRIYTCTCGAGASVKPGNGAMSGLSTIYNGCCFAPGQHGSWPCAGFRKTIEANERLG